MTANSVVTRFSNQRVLYSRKVSTAQNPRFKALVHQTAFSCTKPTIQGVGTPDGLFLYQTHDSRRWYTRRPFPVQNPRLKAVGTPESLFLYKTHDSRRWYTRRPFPVPTPRFNAVGTPESLFLYKTHDSRRLVHQMAFSCTNSTIQSGWYTRKPFPIPTPIIKLSKR